MGHKKNYTNYSKVQSEPVAPVEPVVEEEVAVTEEIVEEVVEDPIVEEGLIGVVTNCARLRVREAASVESDVMFELPVGSEVEIDEIGSTEDFYKVTTASGIEGYCVKTFIEIKS